ncbi:sensor histidine kinase [Calothrix sp. PCC 7507]|uniref:sensor histidine kinase n=1 Tax=Calothrix sp. PCC 7507 TaxID=99598 RepID=UPI00029EF6E4|nr:ATP-binding protein [Calothrix sp. PCC 7507]AFY35099.1 histidine kinase [Calothrix sp. PCC 7507]
MKKIKKYDLRKMTLRNMSECGLALRQLGNNANSMEDVSNHIIEYFYNNLVDQKSGDGSCALIRFFKTNSYEELEPALQKYVCKILDNDVVTNSLKCLTLMATAGELPEWNSRYESVGHQVIPLGSKEAIAQIPMISQLLYQLGLNADTIVKPDAHLLTDLEQKLYNVFYVSNALESPYIPAKESFIIPFNVKSVLGFGGLLPSGNMFAVIMFLKVVLPKMTVDLFRPLSLSVKTAILPFDDGKIFRDTTQVIYHTEVTTNENQDKTIQRLNSQIAVLTQLLDVSEQSTINQSDKLERAIAYLEETLERLKKTQIQLIQNEKMSSLGQMVAGIAHEINNPINFIYGNLIYTAEYTQYLLNLIQLYQKYFPDSPSEILEIIESIDLDFITSDLTKTFKSMQAGTQRIQDIVIGLRNFSRLDESDLKQADIHEGIDSTLMILEHRLKATDKYPEIQVIKEYGELPKIICYPGQLNQVFMNILTNAIYALQESYQFSAMDCELANSTKNLTFMAANYPTIGISTQVIDKKWVVIAIYDNASGMTKEVSSKIFDPFFTTKPVGTGTGLGLAISYQIVVNKHRGQITCNSAPGQGAEFLIKIPMRVD